MERTPQIDQVLTRIRDGIGADGNAVLAKELEDNSYLVCIDNYGDPEQEPSRAILELFTDLSIQSGSRVVLGWSSGIRIPSTLKQVIELGAIDIKSAERLLLQHLGQQLFERIGTPAKGLSLLPGRLVTAAEDIRNGATFDEIVADSADSRSGMAVSAAHFMSDARSVALLRALVIVEDTAPRDIIREIFSIGLDPELRDRASFEEVLSGVRNAGVLWVAEVSAGESGVTETYFGVDREFLAAARRVLQKENALPAAEELECFVRAAINWIEQRHVGSHEDVGWLTAALRAAQLCSQDLARDLGRVLVGQDGPMRTLGTVDEASTAFELIIATADSLKDWDLKQWAALMLAERHYRAADLDQAQAFFDISLKDSPTPDTALKASRAFGQIFYRRGRFADAVAQYEQARELTKDASGDYVATLDIELGKAYARLGRLKRARRLFKLAHTYYESISHTRGRLRASHELARLEEAFGRDDVAREMYTAVLVEAEHDKFLRFTPGPLYQLAILELRHLDTRPDGLRLAIDYQQRCRRIAEAHGDGLWLCLSTLLAGLIEFQKGDQASAERLVTEALTVAREKGFGQAEKDALTWLSSQQLPHTPNRVPAAINRLGSDPMFEALSPGKREKARRYVGEPWRIRRLTVGFESESGIRNLILDGQTAACDCELFATTGGCTHLAALRSMDLAAIQRPENDEGITAP